MKVVLAGISKTGTKSMAEAFRILGFKVHDSMDNYRHHRQVWYDYMDGKATLDDIRESYKNVDAVTDRSAYFFWEQLAEAFPEAKIILTERDEKSWLKSLAKQRQSLTSNTTVMLLMTFTPTGRKLYHNSRHVRSIVFDGSSFLPIIPWNSSQVVDKIRFRQHNAAVIQNAPKERLLVYSVKEGWKPLCNFLNLPIPNRPFPRKNVGASLFDERLRYDPTYQQMKREACVILIALVSALLYFFTCLITI